MSNQKELAAPLTDLPKTEKKSLQLNDLLQKYALIFAWILIIAIFGALAPETFLTMSNFSSMFGSQAVLVVLTLGLLIPLRAGDYDLSGASTLTLSCMTVAILNVKYQMPILTVILIVLAIGALVGLVNAFFSVMIGIDPFIVTLGTGTFLQGIVLWISNSQTISGVSQGLVNAVIVNRLAGIPLGFYYGIALCVILWYVFEYTTWGRRLLFVGQGRNVARLNGIRVGRVRVTSLVLSGMISAFAGILYAGTSGGADPASGLSFLLPAFAAAFLGSTSITPGRFNPWGAFVAVYFLVTGITGLTILGVQTFVQNLFYGGALVLAVAVSHLVRQRIRK
jgi:ribose transport system permease protein